MNAIKCNKAYLGDTELELLCASNKFRDLGDYQVGDAVVWDTKKHLFKVAAYEDIPTINTERFVPTGVIAIPSSHDVYGTGEAGVVALMSASDTKPDTGNSSNNSLCWGGFGSSYNELNSFYNVPKVGIESGAKGEDAIVNNTLISAPLSSYLPSDIFATGANYTKAVDGTYYYYNNDNWNNCIPSPYLDDGSRNPTYYQTYSPSSPQNALSDFAGKSNTAFLCSRAGRQYGWKTATSITNSGEAGYHPAACACWRFHTIGTQQGDWYLPACGELGYACVRRKKINKTIATLQSHFGIQLCQINIASYNHYYLSSSNISQQSARVVSVYDGVVSTGSRNNHYFVRPFTRLK